MFSVCFKTDTTCYIAPLVGVRSGPACGPICTATTVALPVSFGREINFALGRTVSAGI